VAANRVIAFITDLDCIPRASQKPGVAFSRPLVEGARRATAKANNSGHGGECDRGIGS